MYNVHDDPPGFLASERLRFFGECLSGNVLWTWETILDGFRLQDPPQPEPGNEAQAEEIWNYCVRMWIVYHSGTDKQRKARAVQKYNSLQKGNMSLDYFNVLWMKCVQELNRAKKFIEEEDLFEDYLRKLGPGWRQKILMFRQRFKYTDEQGVVHEEATERVAKTWLECWHVAQTLVDMMENAGVQDGGGGRRNQANLMQQEPLLGAGAPMQGINYGVDPTLEVCHYCSRNGHHTKACPQEVADEKPKNVEKFLKQ
jgi:hypothetical protein